MTDLLDRINEPRVVAEYGLASTAFLYPQEVIHACGWLSPDTIRDDQVRQFWTAILEHGDPNKAAMDIGINFFATLAASEGVFLNGDGREHANAISRYDWMSNVIVKLPDMVKALTDGNYEKARHIAAVMDSDAAHGQVITPDLADIGLSLIADLSRDKSSTVYTRTKIDQACGGLWKPYLSILAARPSIGKTALALQIACNVAVAGRRVKFYSLEMSKKALWARRVFGNVKISYRDAMANRLNDQQKQLIIDSNNEMLEFYAGNLEIIDRPQTTRSIWQDLATAPAELVIIDHLRYLADASQEREVKRLGEMTTRLRHISKEFDCHVMVLAQLSRAASDKQPTMQDIRDSGEVEENADIVFGLNREKNDKSDRTKATLEVLKFRDGPAPININLQFSGMEQWFYDPD